MMQSGSGSGESQDGTRGPDAESYAAKHTPASPETDCGGGGGFSSAEQMREELRLLRQREREIVQLLGSESSQRILHDIRNLLNEVQLLRYLVDKND